MSSFSALSLLSSFLSSSLLFLGVSLNAARKGFEDTNDEKGFEAEDYRYKLIKCI